jgi:hypothetical protein
VSSKKIQREVIALIEECYKTARDRADKVEERSDGRMVARATARLFAERLAARRELLEAAIEGATLTATRVMVSGRPMWIEFIDDEELH